MTGRALCWGKSPIDFSLELFMPSIVRDDGIATGKAKTRSKNSICDSMEGSAGSVHGTGLKNTSQRS